MAWNMALEYLMDSGFRVPPQFLVSTLDSCLEFSEEFQTEVPRGLPKIENNFSEGVVIKPYCEQLFMPNGSRLIIKKKGEKFVERKSSPREQIVLSDEEKQAANLIHNYVNEERYQSVVSKLGLIDYEDKTMIGKLIGLLAKDAVEDFEKDYTLSDELNKIAKKEASKAAKEIVLKKF